MDISFLSLSSGSSGNCYYLGCDDYGILIDAGLGLKTIKKLLEENGIEIDSIKAVLITHDHSDHIKSAGILAGCCGMAVYATEAVHNSLARSKFSLRHIRDDLRVTVEKEETFSIGCFYITPFEVPHDSTDNVGYHIEIGLHNFVYVTDIGHVTPAICKYVALANHLIVEANYDEAMLAGGPYPTFLKARVASPTGHLSNRETACLLATHFHAGLKDIWLCHLSHDNNEAGVAYETVRSHLAGIGVIAGKDVGLTVLERHAPSGIYDFDSLEEPTTICPAAIPASPTGTDEGI
ncbi:MAG: MBL fold metallo-hydrolase [Tannerellaceae bacterium]|jgi:phosphoribosyl 1,2-cyclic phosphodiesterase|nr:MBL fold metallo-hydrolase [Tannerellaceae bacterium]